MTVVFAIVILLVVVVLLDLHIRASNDSSSAGPKHTVYFKEGVPWGTCFGHQTDLAQLLATAGKELSDAQDSNVNGAVFRLTVEGPLQTLSPVIQDEVYRIGREILRNAFRHALAENTEVEVRYEDRSGTDEDRILSYYAETVSLEILGTLMS